MDILAMKKISLYKTRMDCICFPATTLIYGVEGAILHFTLVVISRLLRQGPYSN